MTRSVLAAVAIAGLLGGCISLEPAYHRPPPPVPPAFPTGAAYAPAAGVMTVAGWQDVFPDPKLRAVIEQALTNSRDLRVAVAQIEAARAQYRVQRADLFPTVAASAGAAYGRVIENFGGANVAFDEHQYTASVGFTSYELDLFGRIRSLTKAAKEQFFASEQNARSVRISLVAEVAGDYETLASDESLLQIARDTAASGQTTLDLAQARLRGGVATGLDVSSAATVVEQAKSDITRYTTQSAQDLNALQLAVGAPVAPENLPASLDDPATRLATVPTALSSEILLRRPDVLQAEDVLRGANANIGAARAAFFPSITLTGSGGTTSAALTGLFAPGSGIWNFAPGVNLPIFDGGRNSGNLAYARAEDRIDVAQYEKAIQTAFREASDALAQRGTLLERLRAQRALVAVAEQSLRLSNALYTRGSGNYLDVLTAQRTLYAARESLIGAELIAATNGVTLYKVLGGGYAE